MKLFCGGNLGMRISKAVIFIVAALCVGLPVGGSILFVGLQFHPPAHVEKVEVKAAGRPAFVKEEPESYLEKWLYDPVAQATGALAVVTLLLFMSTAKMARDAKATGDKALAASTDATNTLVRIERPYVTVGGEYKRSPDGGIFQTVLGRKFFRLEVGNYGKTPAILTAFDVQFDSLANVQARLNDIGIGKESYDDLLAPGVRHKVIRDDIEITVDINSGTNVAYGACWYRTALQEGERMACFVLKLRSDSAWIDDDVSSLDASYRHRD
jgi:hypothetical protein